MLYTPFPVQISGRDLKEPSLDALKRGRAIVKLTIWARGTNASTLDGEMPGGGVRRRVAAKRYYS